MKGDNVIYFYSFGVEHILKEIKKFRGNKIVTTNIYRIQVYSSVMCRDFSIGFINFMTENRILVDYIDEKHEKNNKTILQFFDNLKRTIWKNIYFIRCKRSRKLKSQKMSCLSSCKSNDAKIMKEKDLFLILNNRFSQIFISSSVVNFIKFDKV